MVDKQNYYERIMRKAAKSLEKAPTEGHLRVVRNKGTYQYFKCTKRGDTKGTYILKKDREAARALAQRDYDKKVLQCAKKWITWIDKMLTSEPKEDLKSIFIKSKNRLNLIHPYEVSDEVFVKEWENEEYMSNPYSFCETEFYTEKGERVRSKSEVIIANTLYSMGIPYKYEKPLYLRDGKTIYPDFTLLDVEKRREVYFEHFGMMDNEEYSLNAYNRIIQYEKNGMLPGKSFLFSMETSKNPLDTRLLKELLTSFML